MKATILDVLKLKKFSEEKRHQETVWEGDDGRINLICMNPGQEIVTHTHHGNHVWIVVEGSGTFLSGKERHALRPGVIVVVPAFEEHGIRTASGEQLVLASITAKGD